MEITRRGFFASMPLALARDGAADFRDCCMLPESEAGFRMLAAEQRCGAALVIPGAGRLSRRQARSLDDHLGHGGSVLLESALGLEKPKAGSPYFPYVDFVWPVRARIREFFPARIKPKPGDTVIATFGGDPAGVRRNAGRGTLIVIGSPVGPSLLSRDPDAERWVAAVLRWIHRHSEAHPCFIPQANPTKWISRRRTTLL